MTAARVARAFIVAIARTITIAIARASTVASARASTVAIARASTVAIARPPTVASARPPTVASARASTVAIARPPTVASARASTVAIARPPTVAIARASTVAIARAFTVAIARAFSVGVARALTVAIARAFSVGVARVFTSGVAGVGVAGSFVLGLAVAGCSASATLSDLRTAERRAAAGDVDGAVVAYRAAQTTCRDVRPARREQAACGEALIGEAEVLEHAGRTRPAIEVYLAIPARAGDDAMTAATATYRAGELLLREREVTRAWTALWKVVTDYPDEPLAGDALRVLVTDGRHRDARALADEIARLLTPLAETQVADNLLWALADLTEHELGNAEAARAIYDRIPADTPASGLRDDARWHAARLSRLLHDPAGAAARLRALLATREVAIGAGSYFSIWLDDAQLALGVVLRDELGDLPGAAAAFRRLPDDYPASILRDDALHELAITLERMGDHPAACAALARLARSFADSKYIARGTELGCR